MEEDFYADYAATAQPDVELQQRAFNLAMTHYGNPSSSHSLGEQAHSLLASLRDRAAKVLNVATNTLIFNSGATEGNQYLMLSFLASVSGQNDILINASEHDAVYQNFLTLQRFNYKIKIINNNSLGQVTPPILAKKLSEKTKFVAVMLLNNETGAINNIAALAKIIDSYASEHSIAPIHLHVDATQALGKINFDINKLNCDSAVFSAHKVGGPRGSGLLYQRKARPSLLSGGGQEFGLRSGTENIFAIAGMVLALEKNYHCINNNGQVMHYFMQQLSKLGAIILPGERLENNEQFCPYIVNCAFMPLPGEVMVRVLSKVGVYISTGSACASNKKKSLRSFNAMGLNANVSSCAVRFSFNPAVSLPFMQGLINRLTKALKDLAYQAVL